MRSALERLDPNVPQRYRAPQKRINTDADVSHFLQSQACRDLGVFLLQLNRAVCPRTPAASPPASLPQNTQAASRNFRQRLPTTCPIRLGQPLPQSVANITNVLSKINSYLDLAPPQPGQQRFGNPAFREWYDIVEKHADDLLDECLPHQLRRKKEACTAHAAVQRDSNSKESELDTAKDASTQEQVEIRDTEGELYSELRSYLLSSLGSRQRLDYGTGHELSFLAFLGCLWKLGVFHHDWHNSDGVENGDDDDSWKGRRELHDDDISSKIVLGIFPPYLALIRRVIKLYNLEPAGSHGVWGLDDHSFLPYIFGSAQLSAPIGPNDRMSEEGSVVGAPKTSDVSKTELVQHWRTINFYFGAIGFTNDIKTGPFWEHSPMLFDISGVQKGWGKINKGMLKMYHAEVLSKFPVVQHFNFGSLFSWDPCPTAGLDLVPFNPPPAAAVAAAATLFRPLSEGTMPVGGPRNTHHHALQEQHQQQQPRPMFHHPTSRYPIASRTVRLPQHASPCTGASTLPPPVPAIPVSFAQSPPHLVTQTAIGGVVATPAPWKQNQPRDTSIPPVLPAFPRTSVATDGHHQVYAQVHNHTQHQQLHYQSHQQQQLDQDQHQQQRFTPILPVVRRPSAPASASAASSVLGTGDIDSSSSSNGAGGSGVDRRRPSPPRPGIAAMTLVAAGLGVGRLGPATSPREGATRGRIGVERAATLPADNESVGATDIGPTPQHSQPRTRSRRAQR